MRSLPLDPIDHPPPWRRFVSTAAAATSRRFDTTVVDAPCRRSTDSTLSMFADKDIVIHRPPVRPPNGTRTEEKPHPSRGGNAYPPEMSVHRRSKEEEEREEEERVARWFADFPNHASSSSFDDHDHDHDDDEGRYYRHHCYGDGGIDGHWYSLHQMVAAGIGLGVLPGEWYGPTTACRVLCELNGVHCRERMGSYYYAKEAGMIGRRRRRREGEEEEEEVREGERKGRR